MIANALILTIAILLALGFWLMGELKFFIPYKAVLLQQYGTALLAFRRCAVFERVCSRICRQPQILSQGYGQETLSPRQTATHRARRTARTFD